MGNVLGSPGLGTFDSTVRPGQWRPTAPGERGPGLGDRERPGATGTSDQPFLPAPALPKGGGAIRGIGEKLSVNPAKGTGSFAVPVYTPAGRGLSPVVGLGYDTAAGSSAFGLGWSLDVPAIRRKTDRGLPRYHDGDTFLLAGAEDLVPSLVDTDEGPRPDGHEETIDGAPHWVERFRPRTEAAYHRIERCRHQTTGETFWRTVDRDNLTSLYGRTPQARIADPADHRRVFQWLIEETRDDRGNLVTYEYRPEDLSGVDNGQVSEAHRVAGRAPVANSYLKCVRYGNRTPGTGADGFLFLVVFDYGDHDLNQPTPVPSQPWPVRADPFSTYRPGFEVRTWRLCRRVLVFHDFPPGELGPGPLPRLVRSTDLTHDSDPVATRLVAVTQTGYLWDETSSSYHTGTLPPVELEYTRSRPDDQVRRVDLDSLENLPVGVDDQLYRFVDLDGEGLSGALTRQGGAWFYKRNLGGGRFGALERLSSQPSVTPAGAGTTALVDLAGDGRRAIVHHGPLLHGYQERQPDGGWAAFRPFGSVPAVDWAGPGLLQTDLDGDGLADLLLADGEVFRWHRSLGRDGYGPQQRALQGGDEERGPVLLASDPTSAVLLADMSGDGLADLVRVRNGEVCYWPNLGHGRFGAKVTMAGPPVFDHPEQFHPGRLRLADIDGSGPTDLVYLGRGQVRFWLNRAGNGFGPAQPVAGFPDVDRLANVQVVDLLGTGTSCLVWSSPLAKDRSLSYVDLSRGVDVPADDPGLAGHKPHLLRTIRNNLGGETRLHYLPSTTFFLTDRAAGTPWATRLPFPVPVVDRVETYDQVARTRLVTSYAYRHGYFDGPEREFRGFGMVEQVDAESFPGEPGAGLFTGPEATELHRPPVRTRTWFHTGAFLDEQVVASQFRAEYYDGDGQAAPLPDSVGPAELTDREAREARRALAGLSLRTEVYAEDGAPVAAHPYTVSEHRYQVRLRQPGWAGRPAVFDSHPLETVTYHYERDPTDPRVGHTLTLEVDEFGTVRQQVTVGYPRRVPAHPEQARTAVLWTVNQVAHTTGAGQPYRLGTPVASRTYQVTGLPDPPPAGRYRYADLATALAEVATNADAGEPGWQIPYEATGAAPAAHPQRRLVAHTRTTYWNDAFTAGLPLGDPGPRALVHQTHTLALTPGLVAQAYGGRVEPAMLTGEGRYQFVDGGWWAPSGVRHYDPAGFYQPVGLTDPFGNTSTVEYDPYHLLVVTAHASQVAPYDGLVTRMAPDYRVLAPRELTDPNGNRSRVAFDALGRVVAAWAMGKDGSGEGDPAGLPGTVCHYHPHSWRDGQGPAWAQVETRERHGDPDSPWQRARAWTDGSGRTAMTKTQAEPGLAWTLDPAGQPAQVDTTPAVRWVGTGRTVFDNKGLPVKRYEPYFSVSPDYEDEAALVMQGVTPVLHYDPLGRLVRTEHPDGTLSRVGFDPWRQETWDGNDTVPESRWYAERGSPDPQAEPEPAQPERRAAWLAAGHAQTPAVAHLDPLGRVFLTVADAGAAGPVETRTELDIEGNPRSVTDARGVVVLRQEVGPGGRVLHTASPDAGQRWTLPDVTGAPARSWDGRGHACRYTYDQLRRPAGRWVRPPGATSERLVVLAVYGESHPAAADRNLRGRPYLTFDPAGMVVAVRHDFKGNLLAGRRHLARGHDTTPDWSPLAGLSLPEVESTAAPLLEPGPPFATATDFDALRRPVLSVLPDSTVVLPRYNEAGLLESVSARLRDDPQETPFVVGLSYDAKGQREGIDYGNGARTVYTYHPLTYRLAHLETLRGPPSHPERLQDLSYVYDPVGNIVEIRDAAQQTAFFAGQVVTPTTRYTYDPLYRLVSATGREHASLGPQPDHREPDLPPLPHPNDAQALRSYTQTYTYDPVGNLLALAHQGGGTGWTRHYDYATDSNRLLAHSLPTDPAGVLSAAFSYDPHGNLTSMPHLATIDWDDADRMRMVDLGGGGTAYYHYDAAGQRVRKVIERLGGLIEERIYLGGYEVHRRRQNGTVSFERQTVHLMDDARRIALVETTTVDGGAPASPPQVRIRYQLDNHLGACSLELDHEAAVISYEEYHPYGTTSLWLAGPGTEVSDRRYRYTGQEKDEETGLYYHGARYYAPWLARWTAADPIGIADGTNGYAYVRNNPVVMTDPSGAQGKTIIVESEFRLFNRRTGRLQTVPGSRTKETITVPEPASAGEGEPDPTAGLESDIVIPLGRVRTGRAIEVGEGRYQLEYTLTEAEAQSALMEQAITGMAEVLGSWTEKRALLGVGTGVGRWAATRSYPRSGAAGTMQAAPAVAPELEQAVAAAITREGAAPTAAATAAVPREAVQLELFPGLAAPARPASAAPGPAAGQAREIPHLIDIGEVKSMAWSEQRAFSYLGGRFSGTGVQFEGGVKAVVRYSPTGELQVTLKQIGGMEETILPATTLQVDPAQWAAATSGLAYGTSAYGNAVEALAVARVGQATKQIFAVKPPQVGGPDILPVQMQFQFHAQ
jgi:RHS repeat-associated protein